MKLFTMREVITQGMEVVLGADPKVGDIQVGRSALTQLEKRAAHMVSLLKPKNNRISVQGTRVLLKAADLVKQGDICRLIKERHTKDQRALVLIETIPGEDGVLSITSGERKAQALNGRVVRSYAPFDEAVGVKLVSPIPILSMIPGSKVVIRRSGKLYGAPSEMCIYWGGKKAPRVHTDKREK